MMYNQKTAQNVQETFSVNVPSRQQLVLELQQYIPSGDAMPSRQQLVLELQKYIPFGDVQETFPVMPSRRQLVLELQLSVRQVEQNDHTMSSINPSRSASSAVSSRSVLSSFFNS